mgnify:CR=1 FL=1
MRIYELARAIARQYDVEVKSSQLVKEFKSLPEFVQIRDSIKSHASSVDDRTARKMFEIYDRRMRDKGTPKPAPSEPKREETGQVQPEQAPVAKQTAAPKAVRPQPKPKPRVGRPPRPDKISPTAKPGRPPRIEPSKVGKIAPPSQPAASAKPGSPSQADPEGKKGVGGESERGVHAVAPKPQKLRPSGLANELKSSSGTTGVVASPEGMKVPRRDKGEPEVGQPKAPPPPRFSADSPFVKPPEPPKPKKAKKPERSEHPTEEVSPSGGAQGLAGQESAPEVLKVPEIGVMKLKPGGKRRRGDKAGRKEEKGEAGAKPSRKRMRPSKVYGGADEFRAPLKKEAKKTRPGAAERKRDEPKPKQPVGPVRLTRPLTVAEFAEKLGVAPADLIKSAFLKGKPITINNYLDYDLAEELAFDMDIEVIVAPESDEADLSDLRIEDKAEDMKPRPPVVTIMGHVDHGKTTILDHYRRSQVVTGEFGGITQHIGAYQVKAERGAITFLDTPGHEAFTAMRARGTKCTDLVVLVVAADDGVMPQTVEAINHAKAAEVPLIVAVNKIDKADANLDRVRNELMHHGVLPSTMGGDVEFVEISAKQGQNMDQLLEIIHLQADVMELKANPDRQAEGVIIESHVDELRGSVATVLVQKGTMHIGDYFVVGQEHGRVRAMLDDHGRQVQTCEPAQPVEVIGLGGTPQVGDVFLVIEDERKAREIAERRQERRRMHQVETQARPVTLEGISDMIAEGAIKELNVILKADVQGSVEAIEQSLGKLQSQEIRIRVLHSGTGMITESDVNLAMASQAIILGFNVRPEAGATSLAEQENVDIKLYRVIYELIADIEKAMVGMLEKKYKEVPLGRSEVRKVFRLSKAGAVAGCYVVDGEMQRNAACRLVRDGTVVYEGRIDSLRRVKDDVPKVGTGYECGIKLERFSDAKEGDVIEAFKMEELTPELTRSGPEQ